MNLSNEIKARVSCQDVCRMYGIEINRNGFAKCPFHNEKTASFKVYPGNRGFYCFGCGASGTVIDLTMKLFNGSAYDACKRLNDDFKLDLIHEGNLSRAERIAQNRELWERRKREAEREEQHKKLIDRWNEAIKEMKLIELLYWEAAPKDPDEDWSEAFVLAASRRDRARAAADEALENLWEFEKMKFAN